MIYVHAYSCSLRKMGKEYAKRLRDNDFVLGRVEQPEPVEECLKPNKGSHVLYSVLMPYNIYISNAMISSLFMYLIYVYHIYIYSLLCVNVSTTHCHIPYHLIFEWRLRFDSPERLLMIDRIKHPENMGRLLSAAVALKFDGVILHPECAPAAFQMP